MLKASLLLSGTVGVRDSAVSCGELLALLDALDRCRSLRGAAASLASNISDHAVTR